MEKWEGRQYFSFPYLCLVGWWEGGGMKIFFVWLRGKMERWKMTLNKFTHMPSLKNDAQLKKKKNH